MLFFYTGTDTETLREKMNTALGKAAKKTSVVRVTDAHAVADLEAALAGGGMFGGPRTVVLDSVFTNEELRAALVEKFPALSKSVEHFYIYESAPDAATRKLIEKYAEKTEKHDLAKEAKKDNFFAIANYLQQGKKKELWVTFQSEIAAGKAPEAIHGILFYGAKQSLLRNPRDERARKMVAELAELPHEARRAGFDMEYALERFVLSSA